MRYVARILILVYQVIGGGSLIVFGVFLYRGPLECVALAERMRRRWSSTHLGHVQRSSFNTAVIIRRWVRDRLCTGAAAHPSAQHPSRPDFLSPVIVLWQPTELIVFQIDGPFRFAVPCLFHRRGRASCRQSGRFDNSMASACIRYEAPSQQRQPRSLSHPRTLPLGSATRCTRWCSS